MRSRNIITPPTSRSSTRAALLFTTSSRSPARTSGRSGPPGGAAQRERRRLAAPRRPAVRSGPRPRSSSRIASSLTSATRPCVVQGDDALADTVQHRVAGLQQRGDLLGLETEDAPPHQPGDEHRAERRRGSPRPSAKRPGWGGRRRGRRAVVTPARPPRPCRSPCRRSRGPAPWPAATDPRVPVSVPTNSPPASATLGSVETLPDLRRLGVGVADAVAVGEDDKVRARGAAGSARPAAAACRRVVGVQKASATEGSAARLLRDGQHPPGVGLADLRSCSERPGSRRRPGSRARSPAAWRAAGAPGGLPRLIGSSCRSSG